MKFKFPYIRFRRDLEGGGDVRGGKANNGGVKVQFMVNGGKQHPQYTKKADPKEMGINRPLPKSNKVLYRMSSEDYERSKRKILDPRGSRMQRWNKVFLAVCLVSLFIDPLFFYLPGVSFDGCVEIDNSLEVALTVIRSVADVFYIIDIFLRFRTAYVAPSSRVFGRGQLVMDASEIAATYLRTRFCIDVIAALPLPQMLIWVIIPYSRGGSTLTDAKNLLRFILIFQYLPRLFLMIPLTSQIIKADGVVTKTAWAGAAYNLMLYMLASHVLGACYYLLAIEREQSCWQSVCDTNRPCEYQFFDCQKLDVNMIATRNRWIESSNITQLCSPDSDYYPYGIYNIIFSSGAASSPFLPKYFYCLWWGLQNLSCLGQTMVTSTYIGENCFAILVGVLGLVLFAQLIGNMQMYLKSTTTRVEEWRIQRTDAEQWMKHRQLPQHLKLMVRQYDQFKWIATGGVEEEGIVKGLPMDLRRDIKRHLCLNLVRRVPLFDEMDDRTLDAICERLKPALYTSGTCIVREGDLINEMLFVIRGEMESMTTNGGRSGFFDSCKLGPGHFCGEELLTWALDPRTSSGGPETERQQLQLRQSTRTVKAQSEVEAFALSAEDLKFVALQFRRLHSKQLKHKFKFYSHQWRTWAACFIQSAWRRHRKIKPSSSCSSLDSHGSIMNRIGTIRSREMATAILMEEAAGVHEMNGMQQRQENLSRGGSNVNLAYYAARLARTTRGTSMFSRASDVAESAPDSPSVVLMVQKPSDLDFFSTDNQDD